MFSSAYSNLRLIALRVDRSVLKVSERANRDNAFYWSLVVVSWAVVWLVYYSLGYPRGSIVFGQDTDPNFVQRDALEPWVSSKVRTQQATEFLMQVKSPAPIEGDVCPIIIEESSASKTTLWNLYKLTREDATRSRKQVSIAQPTLVYSGSSTSIGERSSVEASVKRVLVDDLPLQLKSEDDIKLRERYTRTYQHAKAWQICAASKGLCRYCFIIEDGLHIVDRDFRRALYEIFVLADRNSMDWGVVLLAPIPPFSAFQGRKFIVLFIATAMVAIWQVGPTMTELKRLSMKYGLVVILISVLASLIVLARSKHMLLPRPNIVPYSHPIDVFKDAYMVKPKDGESLAQYIRDDQIQAGLPVNNTLVRFFRRQKRGDLKILTASVDYAPSS